MKISSLFLVLVIALLGCETIEETETLPKTLEMELLELLEGPTIEPIGNHYKSITYSGSSDQILLTRNIIYPAIGDVTVHIGMNVSGDTVWIGLNRLKNGVVQSSQSFDYWDHKAVLATTTELVYDTNGLLQEIYSISDQIEKKLEASYKYDSSNKLMRIDYYGNYQSESKIFTHDDNGRIASEWRAEASQENIKFDFLVYEYSDDLLIAKKSGERGRLEGDFQDAFQYFYDDLGRLIVQKEYDPYFDFQQKSRTELFYY